MHAHEQLLQLKCGLFYDKIRHFGYYFIVYWQNITQVNIFKCFCAIFYTFDVKDVTFQEEIKGTYKFILQKIKNLSKNNQSPIKQKFNKISHDDSQYIAG